MALQPFTDNFEDNSTEAGFQFTFYCDICREGYKTKFTESSTHRNSGFLKGLGQAISLGTSLVGHSDIGSHVERGSNILTESFEGMSPEWHREHDKAFELAQNEAKGHFKRCAKCAKWVCDNDYNEEDGLCTECAPREAVEVAGARAQKRVRDIQEKAEGTKVFTGEIEAKQTLCPKCGKPAGQGKFCGNCGQPLGLAKCGKCGAKNPAGTRFCGECGDRIS